MKTIRLTMAQALVRFLENQYISYDGIEHPFVEGVIMLPGHGNVVGLGQALAQEAHRMQVWQGKNEQGMAHTAVAFAKQCKRKKIIAVTSSVGPGAANMVTAAATATANNIPVLILPGDVYACRQPDPVLQQVEQTYDLSLSTNDAFRPVCRYWDRVVRPEQLMSAMLSAMRVLTDPANTGAVCVAMPQDVEGEAYDYPESFFAKRVHRLARREPEAEIIAEAAEIVRNARRPMLICGGGVRYSEAHEEFRKFAETTGIPYQQIVVLAILPAFLYFAGIFIAVHLEAKKLGLKGIPRSELPKFKELAPKLYLLLPLVILVWLVSTGKNTMAYSAAIAIFIAIAVGAINIFVNKACGFEDASDNISLMKVLDALEAGGKGTISVAAACSMAGIVAGCVTSTGLASDLLRTILSVSGGMKIVALFLTMLCCIVLGMGVPTTANYCIMAATCAPILMSDQIGIKMICAHFFVFYFGIVADITPPVALAAYAGSAIAKAPPMKTAFNATKLAIAAFVVPYIFALNPAMLFQFEAGTSPTMKVVQSVLIVITSLAGLYGVAAALNGYLYRPMNPLFRILIAAGGLCMMIPGNLTDVVGVVVVVGVVIFQRASAKNGAAA